MTPKIISLVNPAAGGGIALEVYNRYVDFLKSHSITVVTYYTKGYNDETSIRDFIIQKSPDIISVIGGDGTLNIVLNSLPSLNYKIHLVPAGTGNDLSKIIYENLTENQIFELIITDYQLKNVDSWKCNEKRFINCFGAGFDGVIAHKMFRRIYTLHPKLKYWIEIFQLIFTFKSSLLSINGKIQPCFMVVAANGKSYGGGFRIAPKADLIDGRVDLIIIGKVPILKRFYYLPIVEKGKHLGLDIVTYSQNETVKITSLKPLPAQIDGEPMLASSYEISREGKINFLVK